MRARVGWVWAGVALLLLAVTFAAFVGWTFRHRPFPGPFHSGASEGPVQIRYTGIAGYEVTDGETVVLVDPVVSRPTVWRLLAGPLEPDLALSREVFPRADFILIQHAHYDHAIDAPEIALRTGATVVGSHSVGNLMRSRGVPEAQIREVRHGEQMQLGSFTSRAAGNRHSPIYFVEDPMSGVIPADAGPLWFWEYRNDQVFAFRLASKGVTAWFSLPGDDLSQDTDADYVITVADRPLTPERMKEIVRKTGAHTVIPTHFDNFFQPRKLGMAFLPFNTSLFESGDERSGPARTLLLDYEQSFRLTAGRGAPGPLQSTPLGLESASRSQ